jgi:MFS family permease
MSIETGQRRRGIAAAIGCISIVGLMTGLTWPLLSLILDHEGVDPKLIGLSSATQSASLFVVSPLAPVLITRLGFVRTIYLCIALAVTMLLLLPLFPNVYAWFPIRFLLGGATTTIFIAGETWIVQATAEGKRGRVIGLFGFLWAGSFAAGPLIINATGIEGWPPLLAGAGIVLLASLTLPFAHAGAPKIQRAAAGGIGRLLRMAPATLTAMIMLGALDAVNDSFVPLYGIRNGLATETAVSLLTVLLAGIMLAQFPAGWLADRVEGRRLLIGVTIVIAAGWLLLPAAIGRPWLAWPVALAIGAAGGTLWLVTLMLAGERFAGADLAAANAVRGVLYGVGSFGGPTLAGLALDIWSPHGVVVVMVAIALLFLPVAVFMERRSTRPSSISSQKRVES